MIGCEKPIAGITYHPLEMEPITECTTDIGQMDIDATGGTSKDLPEICCREHHSLGFKEFGIRVKKSCPLLALLDRERRVVPCTVFCSRVCTRSGCNRCPVC